MWNCQESKEAASCAAESDNDCGRSLLHSITYESGGDGEAAGTNVDGDGEELGVGGGVSKILDHGGHGIRKSVDAVKQRAVREDAFDHQKM